MIERLTKNEAPSLLDTDKANELIDAINGLLKSRGAGGISVKTNGDGSLLIAPGQQGSTAVKYSPFEVISVSNETVVINPGMVNGVIPSNLSVDNGEGESFICLDIKGDRNGIVSVSVVREVSAPEGIKWEKNGVNTSFKYVIAIVNGGSLVSQIVNRNLSFHVDVAYEIPKEVVNIGEYPNDIYFTWRQTEV